jgi:hypothetical protein
MPFKQPFKRPFEPTGLLQRLLAGCWLALACLACAQARAEAVPEHEMKAAFVYNFTVFTEWPPEALAAGVPLAVCASPGNPLFPALESLRSKPMHGRQMALRTTAGSVRGCHVLVLDRGDRERWPQWKRDLDGSPVLTVTDDRVIGRDGAIITVSSETAGANQRMGFDIDMAAVRGAHLTLSSKLLRLARSVQ